MCGSAKGASVELEGCSCVGCLAVTCKLGSSSQAAIDARILSWFKVSGFRFRILGLWGFYILEGLLVYLLPDFLVAGLESRGCALSAYQA